MALLIALGTLLAGCGSALPGERPTPGARGNGTPTQTTGVSIQHLTPTPAGACKPRVTAPAPVPPPPAPTPLVPQGEKVYRNTTMNFSVKYAANWFVADSTSPTGGLMILNYNPTVYAPTGGELAPPPYNAISVGYVENPMQLSPEAYNSANQPFSRTQIGTLACWEALSRAQVGGHAAFALVVWSSYATSGHETIYRPSIRTYVEAGKRLLLVDEYYSEGGTPSVALRQITSSLTFGS